MGWPPIGRLVAHLESAGVDVTVAPGPGWTDMVFHPERYMPPLDVFDRGGGVAGARPDRWPDGERDRRAVGQRAVGPDGRWCRRSARRRSASTSRSVRSSGSSARRIDPPAAGLCAVFLNAGAVRRIGPNRLWVETNRRWNARGVATIRMDMEGLGEADGDPARYVDVGNFYTDEFGAQVGAILDDLERRGFGPRFVLVGLCAGGYWAFHTAAADPRVVEAIIVNPRAMIWEADLLERREAQKVGRLLEPALWDRIVQRRGRRLPDGVGLAGGGPDRHQRGDHEGPAAPHRGDVAADEGPGRGTARRIARARDPRRPRVLR